MGRRDLPVPEPPDAFGAVDGLAYALFLPPGEPAGGVVILHGAGSVKENHFDFARACRASDLSAVVFDQRGHGESEGPADDRLIADVIAVAGVLPPGPVALRGSSMGGYLALVAAGELDAAAVVALCPASADMLRRGLKAGMFEFDADAPAMDAFLAEHPLEPVVSALRCPLLLLHAEGDERVPVEHSRALIELAGSERKQLVAMPGGHHRSIQHDPELQGVALRFIGRAFARR